MQACHMHGACFLVSTHRIWRGRSEGRYSVSNEKEGAESFLFVTRTTKVMNNREVRVERRELFASVRKYIRRPRAAGGQDLGHEQGSSRRLDDGQDAVWRVTSELENFPDVMDYSTRLILLRLFFDADRRAVCGDLVQNNTFFNASFQRSRFMQQVVVVQ